jgi:acyl carrier protein
MHIDEFLSDLERTMDLPDKLNRDTRLVDTEGFDSLAVMSLIAYIDETFGKTLTSVEVKGITDIQSLITLVGEEKFES